MSEKKTEKELLQWHSAFYAGIQIELEKEADLLFFENEHQLGTRPMEIDVLIIKKNGEVPIRKNIGRIFRRYNVIEYKSPEDYLSIDDFYKVYGYCCFYKSDEGGADAIKVEELTISFVCSKYPQKLIWHLRNIRHYSVECVECGIYQVQGDFIPIQIIVIPQLSKDENLWLKSLTYKIKETTMVEALLKSYKENVKKPLYKSVMDMVVRANKEKFVEVQDMCEALEELFKDKIEERVKMEIEERVKMEIEERVKIESEAASKEAARIGWERGKKRVNDLNIQLIKQNRFEDVVKASADKEYQDRLFEEFGL